MEGRGNAIPPVSRRRDADEGTFSVALRCHDASGELYPVALTRGVVTVSGFEADAILTAVEAWADAAPALVQGAESGFGIANRAGDPRGIAGTGGLRFSLSSLPGTAPTAFAGGRRVP